MKKKITKTIINNILQGNYKKLTLNEKYACIGTYSPNTNFSYNMDEDDADHMAYLESRVSRSQPGSHHSSFSGMGANKV